MVSLASTQAKASRGLRRQQVDERLLSAVQRLLDRGHNLQGLTAAQLARETGLSSSTFCRCFPEQGEWIARVMEMVCAELVDSAREALSPARRQQDVAAALKAIAAACGRRHAILLAIDGLADRYPAVERCYLAMMQAIRGRSRADPGEALSWALVLHLAHFAPSCEGAAFERLVQAAAQMLPWDEFGRPDTRDTGSIRDERVSL